MKYKKPKKLENDLYRLISSPSKNKFYCGTHGGVNISDHIIKVPESFYVILFTKLNCSVYLSYYDDLKNIEQLESGAWLTQTEGSKTPFMEPKLYGPGDRMYNLNLGFDWNTKSKFDLASGTLGLDKAYKYWDYNSIDIFPLDGSRTRFQQIEKPSTDPITPNYIGSALQHEMFSNAVVSSNGSDLNTYTRFDLKTLIERINQPPTGKIKLLYVLTCSPGYEQADEIIGQTQREHFSSNIKRTIGDGKSRFKTLASKIRRSKRNAGRLDGVAPRKYFCANLKENKGIIIDEYMEPKNVDKYYHKFRRMSNEDKLTHIATKERESGGPGPRCTTECNYSMVGQTLSYLFKNGTGTCQKETGGQNFNCISGCKELNHPKMLFGLKRKKPKRNTRKPKRNTRKPKRNTRKPKRNTRKPKRNTRKPKIN